MPKPSKETQSMKTKQVESQEDEVEEVEVIASEDEVERVVCGDFDVNRLYFRAQEPNKDATQLMCFPKYMYDKSQALTPENFEKYGKSAVIVTEPIKMSKGGIPRHNPKYHGNDLDSMKRAYFYIPKNETDANSMELFACIQRIDDYMVEEINENGNESGVLCVLNSKKKKIKLKGITYTRMITTAKPGSDLDLGENDDDDDDKKGKKGFKDNGKKKEFVPWDRIKIKFSTDWDENLGPNDKKDINTQIYIGDKDTPENCKTVTDFEKHFMWNCVAQFALMMNKVWIMKTDTKACSIGIKCVQIGVTEQPDFKKSVSISKQLNKRLFASPGPLKVIRAEKTGSDDEEVEKNLKKPSIKVTKPSAKATKKVETEDDDEKEEEQEQEEEEEEEEVVEKNTKKTSKTPAKPTKASKKVETEEEEDAEDAEDEEDAEAEEENEDASEPESEDEKPPPKSKKATPVDVKVKGKTPEKKPAADKKAKK